MTAPADRRGLMQGLATLSTFVAPVTLVAAVLFYVGWVRTRSFYGFFGVNSELLGFAPHDYMLRSAEVGLGAVLLLTLAGGFLLVLNRMVAAAFVRLERRSWSGLAWPALGVAGGALVLGGLLTVTVEATVAVTPPLTSAGLIAVGAVLLLRFGSGSSGRAPLLGQATAPFGVVVLALVGLWAANSYAQWIGVQAAVVVDRDIGQFPVVTIFSDKPLDLPGKDIVASYLSNPLIPDGAPRHRYTGARLLYYGNERWFLITNAGAGGYRSSVLVLQDTDSIQVEMATPQVQREAPTES